MQHVPRWVQAVIVFTRLTITQLFIIFTISLCVFLFAKDMGYINDIKSQKLDAVLQAVTENSSAIRSQSSAQEKHSQNTEDLANSVKQTARYLCWTSKISEAEKQLACTK